MKWREEQLTGVVTEGEATMQPEVDGSERCYKDRGQGLAEMGEEGDNVWPR